jgi:hypothetical protein
LPRSALRGLALSLSLSQRARGSPARDPIFFVKCVGGTLLACFDVAEISRRQDYITRKRGQYAAFQ